MSFLNFVACTDKLSNIQRFSQCFLAKNENVLEHTGQISLISFYLAKEIESYGYDIDYYLLYAKSIFHDFDEIITGDIANPIKYHNDVLRAEISKLEHESIKNLEREFCCDWLYDIWSNAKSGPEGTIIGFCDVICALLKFHNEICNRGNKNMLYLMEFNLGIKLKNKIEQLEKHFPLADSLFNSILQDCELLIRQIKTVK